ncbi:SusC/RagA family TonB-linked outer membrane protein [Dyadobacter sediminis]|uniref:SusC/RagA family TonB-linked outer membrane protein n=1 Tax=Dyadobacter sediminis TaxID=1493691 RepID=A0A5R9K6U0_9BACT|nr:SusC/RagA family TonB-linked outer membrane protein [Dyadobacter sediminis]TLU89488.1 SusC/RagA family TonB-linked outer membrane protein [Dyadobacter sediminis]GGC04970.1 SusC/RagA family TonB-linked outer membrane protein [Dyadobacter sediminis]
MGKILLRLTIMLMVVSSPVFAQTITGTVKSGSDGQSLPGVSVLIKGTTNGTTTDADGKFSIAASENSTLVFSFIGYKSIEAPVGNKTTLDVVLNEDASQLNEVVVTALGISKEQRALGYATAIVNNEALIKTASPNFATALYGKAPGVTINATPGGATSGVSINIRGFSSITGNTQPLIVLDGIPIRNGESRNGDYWGDQRIRGNGLLDLNPADIENISVLKGASAAALYGSEAVNGVLLVTTKSGKGKKGIGVDFNASYNVDKIAYLPRYQNVRGPGYPLNYNDGGQDAAGFIYYDTDGDGVKETRGLLGTSVNFGPKFDGQPVMAFDGKIRPYSPSGNSYADLFENASSSNINLSISKSSDNSNIRFSFTRQDNGMISYNSKNSKNIANLNASFNLNKKLTTDIMVNYVNQNTRNRPFKVDRMINNFTGMMNRFESADWYFDKYQTSLGYKYVTGTNPSLTPGENIIYNGFKGDIADYIWNTRKNQSYEYSDRVIASLTQHWQILESLKLRGRIATDYTSERLENWDYSTTPLAFGYTGGFGMNNNQYNNVYGDVLLTYTKKFSDDATISLLGGYSANRQLNTFVSRSTNGGLSTVNFFDISASVNIPTGNQTRSRWLRDAYIGTVNFDYKNIFFVEGTIRRDRTSTLATGNNAFVYPSVNASFVFSDALNLPSFWSYGKLRGSFGVVGNYPTIYQANIAYQQGSLSIQQAGGQSVLYTSMSSDYGNDKIRPEQKREFEFGLETKLFNNRIGLDIAYYNAQIVDQILPLSIAATTGARTVLENIGTLRNQGVEVAFNVSPLKAKTINDFNWDLTLNLSRNVNKVEKLANNSTELLHADFDGNAAQIRSVVGRPMGDIFVHGILKDSQGRSIVGPNGLYTLDGNNWIKAGNAMPKLTGGLLNSFSYKNFTLDAVIDFRVGGHIMPTGINWMTSRGLTEESLNAMDAEHGGLSYYVNEDGKGIATTGTAGPNGQPVYHDGMLMDGVTTTGEANTNIVSQATYYNSTYNWGGPQYGNARYELYVKENTYFKMRELSLAYRLPAVVGRKIGAQNISVSVFGRNLFFLYRTIKDLDAEQTSVSTRWYENINNAGSNPSFRTMGVMLRASF